MKSTNYPSFFIKPVTKAVLTGCLLLASTHLVAKNFQWGDVDISFDSTFSYGSSWRVESRDWNNLVGKSNNTQNNFNFQGYNPLAPDPSKAALWASEGRYSTNADNGNLNYDAGDMFSSQFKGSHDLDIRYDNIGIFLRGIYFYDFAADDTAYINPSSNKRHDPCRDNKASERLCHDVRLLDAFIYSDFIVNDMPLSLRLGQQVISWGESTLISHGISELNPVDVARLKAPGSELKEAFIPFGALWASLAVSENFNIEAFYQYQWEKTILPVPGSYFSTNDFAGLGGHYNNVQLGFANIPDMDLDFLLAQLNDLGDGIRSGNVPLAQAPLFYLGGYPTNVTLKAPNDLAENKPSDGGQYGLRLSWYVPQLNDTEISAYYVNYHSRRPISAGLTANFSQQAIGADLQLIASAPNAITEENYYKLQAFSKAKLDYPEDIKLYALSFNTSVGETSVAGEMSYRQDEPLQIDDVELLFAAMPQQLANSFPTNPQYAVFNGISQLPVYQGGERAEGFILSDTLQAQVTLTHTFGPTLSADQFTTLIEFGGIDIRDMPSPDILRLNGPGTDRNGGINLPEPLKTALELGSQDGVEATPFPTDFSWGYRVVAKLDYNNVFASINVSPKIVFSHDVNGITPDPLFMFVEDRKTISLGITLDYQSRWSADLSYNGFWGGLGTSNQMSDRDYVSFSIKYSI